MSRQMYVPSGASANFIAFKCMWCDDEKTRFSSNDKAHKNVNEYSVLKQKSTLWDVRTLHRSASPNQFSQTYPKLAKSSEVWDDKDFSFSTFKDLLKEGKFDGKVLEDWEWYWLPIFDYSIYLTLPAGRIPLLDTYLKKLINMCWKAHEQENKELMSITHYHPGLNLKGYEYSTDIEKLCLSINGCEDYISDLLAIKHNSTRFNNEVSDFCRYRIDNNIFDQQKSDIVVEYRKVFFENDEDEIRKLYEFFGNEDYFDKNTNDITTKFKQYHNDNFRVWEEFDWEASNIERQL